jgi:hypothetical protein
MFVISVKTRRKGEWLIEPRDGRINPYRKNHIAARIARHVLFISPRSTPMLALS